jgi:hypothetical protein
VSTETKTTLAEMVLQSLNACDALKIAQSQSDRLLPPITTARVYWGVHTQRGLSLVMDMARDAGRPIHKPVSAAATWLRRNFPDGFGLDLYRFSIEPSSKPGSAALFVEDETSDSRNCVALFYAAEIGHDWQGYFEFWAARNLHAVALDWVLILPEEY